MQIFVTIMVAIIGGIGGLAFTRRDAFNWLRKIVNLALVPASYATMGFVLGIAFALNFPVKSALWACMDAAGAMGAILLAFPFFNALANHSHEGGTDKDG